MTSLLRRFALLSVGLAFVATAAPTPALTAEPKPAGVAVAVVEESLSERDVDATVWAKVPATEIELTTAPSVHPAIQGETVTARVTVQAARSGKDLLFRLRWKDDGADAARGPGKFVDGAAVQFASDGDTRTNILMGGEGRHVDVWHWNAATNGGANLLANGTGTLTPNSGAMVKASGRYAKGQWTVVIRRELAPSGTDAVTFGKGGKGTVYPVAFAIWNGRNGERDGFKAVTVEWQELRF